MEGVRVKRLGGFANAVHVEVRAQAILRFFQIVELRAASRFRHRVEGVMSRDVTGQGCHGSVLTIDNPLREGKGLQTSTTR